ncbi:hypothetical protein [Candidatus Poriferisodalis sp.]|uniref:hypothetical protein n=1 Tax=Candidatus Poriferisodalis sp. TaxID=3101277 RepID=UPI003B02E6E2
MEVDLKHQSRLRALELVKQKRSSPGRAPDASPLEMLVSALLADLPDRVSRGANAISRTRNARPDELQQIAADIADLEAWASETPQLRPLGAYARHVKITVEHLIGVFDVTVAILEARRGSDAQQLEPQLQEHLDAATAAISRCNELSDQITELALSDNAVATWIRFAIGDDMVAAEARGRAILEDHRLTSDQVSVGVLAVLWDFISGSTSDDRSFWCRAAQHQSLLARHRDRVVELAESEIFKQRASDALDDLLHAARLAVQQDDSESQRQHATELLDFGHRLVEQPLKLHLGIACAATTSQRFESTQASDVAALIGVANQKGWAVASLLGDSDIRNAFAHRDYSVRADGMIELCPARCAAQGRPSKVMSLDELCDAVLAISEACGAMDMAFALVTGRCVGDHADGTSPFLVRSHAEGLLGWEDVAMRLEEDEAVIEARTTRPVKFAEIGPLASTHLGDHSRLIIRLTTNGGDHEIRISVPEIKEWSHVDGETARSAAFLVAWHRAKIDGAPAFTDAQVRKALAVQALQLLADETKSFGDSRHELASLRTAAKAVGDHDLAKAIASCIGWRAENMAGHQPASNPIDRLVDIASADVQPVSEWIIAH